MNDEEEFSEEENDQREEEEEEYPHPYAELYNGKKRNKNNVKAVFKFLAAWKNDPKMTAHILRHAPPRVIKGLANLAYNMKHNPDISLSRHQKLFCRRNRKVIDLLSNPYTTVERKRRSLTAQRGGALPLLLAIPPLIAAGLKFLGPPILGAVASGIATRLASRREDE